jgi:hypothetical protein
LLENTVRLKTDRFAIQDLERQVYSTVSLDSLVSASPERAEKYNDRGIVFDISKREKLQKPEFKDFE